MKMARTATKEPASKTNRWKSSSFVALKGWYVSREKEKETEMRQHSTKKKALLFRYLARYVIKLR